MPTKIIMPALGMSQDTGRLVAWLKQEGDHVNQGDPIMEIETDKTTVEIEAPATGILSQVMAQPGDDVPVGDTIAVIFATDENAPESTTSDDTEPMARGAEAKSSLTNTATPVARRMASAHGVDVTEIPSQGERLTKADVMAYINGPKPDQVRLIPASPKARRLAVERGIDLAVINGSGPEGAVVASDVDNHITVPAPARLSMQPVATGRLWQRMAERLTESWQTVPHFYLKREVDVSALVDWRSRIQARTPTKVTYTDLLIKLVAAALKQHPHVNGQWTGSAVAFNEESNIGLAVALHKGLLVPVIHRADMLGITEIAQRRSEIVERAQSGRLKPDDLQGGTFTISNLGMYGIDEFSAIVNPPQAAILAVGRIAERAVPQDGQIVIRPMMTLNLSCDHRAVDGLRGAQFLSTLADFIDDPLSLID